eukprot:g413.t1
MWSRCNYWLLWTSVTVAGLLGIIIRSVDVALFNPKLHMLQVSEGPVLLCIAVVAGKVLFGMASARNAAALTCSILLLTRYYGDFSIATPRLDVGQLKDAIVITGANSGIGFAVAEKLAQQGHPLVLACRSQKKCDLAKQALQRYSHGARVESLGNLDLGSIASISAWVKEFPTDLHVQMLVNNAGYQPDAGSVSKDGFEGAIGVMHLGHFHLTELLHKSGSLSSGSLVLHVSSAAMRMGSFHRSLMSDKGEGDWKGEYTIACAGPVCPPVQFATVGHGSSSTWKIIDYLNRRYSFGAYARAKLANYLHAREIVTRYPGVLGCAVHPGMVKTSMATGPLEEMTGIFSLCCETV